MLQWLSIIVLAILACVTYGIVHDQFTARICVEYFTIGHPRVIPSDDPTLLGFVWGVLATWWVGVILGVPLATIARVGSRPPKTVGSLIPPVAILFVGTGALAFVAACVGYVAATNGWVQLVGSLAERVPREKHVPFLTDLWAHNASYLGGFVGGIILMIWVWRSRGRMAEAR
ncbi:MAG: hypothetical protein QGG36_15365 [Pirellulaceae bacterium]|nr:hypothetical protein [Pirellulaceae bacterium]